MNTDVNKDAVLGGMLYFRSTREQYLARNRQNSPNLFGEFRSAYTIIENWIKLYIQADISTSASVILEALIQGYDRLPPNDQSTRIEYSTVLEKLCEAPRYTEKLANSVLKTMAITQELERVKATLSQPRTMQETMQSINQFQQAVTQADVGGSKLRFFDPFQDMEILMKHYDFVPTGVSFLDRLLGGGIILGEHTGILGPTSGGKTMLANQVAANACIIGHKVAVFQFEQSIEHNADVVSRFYSYITKSPITAFRNKAFKDIDPALIHKIRDMYNLHDHIKFASMVDRNKGTGSTLKTETAVQIIKNAIIDLIESGFKPNIVIFDWLGAIITDLMKCNKDDKQAYQIIAEQIMSELNDFCKPLGISIIYIHQTDMATQEQNPAYKPKETDAYYFHAFPVKLENCFQMGTSSYSPDRSERVCWLVAGKTRGSGAKGESIVVKIDGLMMRIDETRPGEWTIGTGGQLRKTSQLLNIQEKSDTIYTPREGSIDAFMSNY